MSLALLLVIAGLGALLLGGEALVTGAARLARRLGVSPLAIGLTVVAFGTSAPELAVSVIAAIEGTPDIAVGNVFGSNIFNVLVAVGGPAAMTGLVIRRDLFKREIPFCVLANVLVIGLAWTGLVLERWEGIVLLVALVGFLFWVARTGRSEDADADDDADEDGAWKVFAAIAFICGLGAAASDHGHPEHLLLLAGGALTCGVVMHFNARMGGLLGSLVLIPMGFALLIGGSHVLVVGATTIARSLSISEATIGLTVVAIGTSAPELAAGLIAARRGLSDIVLGNAIGSNLFNLLSVLGAASVIHPMKVARQFLEFDAWIALLTVVLLLPLAATKTGRLSRFAGWLLVCLWIAYTTMLLVMEGGG